MPSDDSQAGTCIKELKKQRGLALPFLKDFCDHINISDNIYTSKDLHLTYNGTVTTRTTDAISLEAASNFPRFCLQFAKIAKANECEKVRNPVQGYKVTYKKPPQKH